MIQNFDSPQLTERMVDMAECFLVKCSKSKTELETFEELCVEVYENNALKLQIEKLPCTSIIQSMYNSI